MRTALECLPKDEHCDCMAWAGADAVDRCVLRTTANHWRTLARAAKLFADKRDGNTRQAAA